MKSGVKLGTRGSQLALWQARLVKSMLETAHPGIPVEIVVIETDGDRVQSVPLSSFGGFGVFTKAIQEALLARTVDIAVHSLKDLPTIPVEGLQLAAVTPRGPLGDALVSQKWSRFDDLPPQSTVGSSSLRRKAQLLLRRPDLNVVDLRGNVETRLRKLAEQQYDAIVLAEAGLVRLGLAQHITEILDPTWMLPAVGQGAVAIECRTEDENTRELMEKINHHPTWQCVQAERHFLSTLGGGCLVPVGCLSRYEENTLSLTGAVFSTDGKQRIGDTVTGMMDKSVDLGNELARLLVDRGAKQLLSGMATYPKG
ncbi:MAG: hydroxymethylbilane synthase [Zavarzinella sp.]